MVLQSASLLQIILRIVINIAEAFSKFNLQISHKQAILYKSVPSKKLTQNSFQHRVRNNHQNTGIFQEFQKVIMVTEG